MKPQFNLDDYKEGEVMVIHLPILRKIELKTAVKLSEFAGRPLSHHFKYVNYRHKDDKTVGAPGYLLYMSDYFNYIQRDYKTSPSFLLFSLSIPDFRKFKDLILDNIINPCLAMMNTDNKFITINAHYARTALLDLEKSICLANDSYDTPVKVTAYTSMNNKNLMFSLYKADEVSTKKATLLDDSYTCPPWLVYTQLAEIYYTDMLTLHFPTGLNSYNKAIYHYMSLIYTLQNMVAGLVTLSTNVTLDAFLNETSISEKRACFNISSSHGAGITKIISNISDLSSMFKMEINPGNQTMRHKLDNSKNTIVKI